VKSSRGTFIRKDFTYRRILSDTPVVHSIQDLKNIVASPLLHYRSYAVYAFDCRNGREYVSYPPNNVRLK